MTVRAIIVPRRPSMVDVVEHRVFDDGEGYILEMDRGVINVDDEHEREM